MAFEDVHNSLADKASSSVHPLIKAAGISKSFAAIQALREIDFDLREGEVHALIGENGAGKSTFTKIVTGVLSPDSGHLEICGHPVNSFSPDDARSLGVSAIYQQPSLFPHLSVAENIALVLERGQSSWKVDWNSRYERAEHLITRLGAQIDPYRPAHSLSMAEQQIVEIAKAIGANSKIIFMDEPTALLTEREVNRLFQIISDLRAKNVGIVYISHRLEEIQSIADRITVLRDGRTIACKAARDLSRNDLISLMVGRSVASIYPKRDISIGKVALSVSQLKNSRLGLHNISFSVHAGEILGFAGLVGSGRTELAETLFGLVPCDSPITFDGRPCHITSPKHAIGLGIGYLPEDRRQHGLIMQMSIANNISMAVLQRISRAGAIDRKIEQALASTFVSRLGIKTPNINVTAASLSGGNQQKVALARWLATKPRVMILDEPTQGVDVGAKAEIHEIITTMAENGVAIILISSELPEIVGMCDRVAVFYQQTISTILPRELITQENIMNLAFGHQLEPTNIS